MNQPINETPVQIIINGRAAMTIMTSAEDPTDLVVGQLYTERAIETYADISSMHTDGSRKTVLAGCGGAASFLDSGRLGNITSDLAVSATQIRSSAARLPKTSWYSGALFTEDGRHLVTATDLTSQNVADQIIGWGLAHSINFAETYILFSGNIVAETVRKAVIAKIPLLITDAEITATAVAAADDAGMTVCKLVEDTLIPHTRSNHCIL